MSSYRLIGDPADVGGPERSKDTAVKANGVHYTPDDLARFLARAALSHVQAEQGCRVLDPACGDGALLRAVVHELTPSARGPLRIVAYETDSAAADLARSSLEGLGVLSVEVVEADFLLSLPDEVRADCQVSGQGSLFAEGIDSAADMNTGRFDIVISNPPYVRTQVLGAERAQKLAKSFGLTGRVDLAHAFALGMSRMVASDGVLALLTSNRFMTTRSGSQVRAFLRSQFRIVDVYDLGDTKMFSAAVLPAIVIAKRQREHDSTPASFVRVYRSHGRSRSPVDAPAILAAIADPTFEGELKTADGVFGVERGHLAPSTRSDDPWCMSTARSGRWLQTLEEHRTASFQDVVEIKVGVKTTADSVFIRADWEELPPNMRPEDELLHSLLTHHEATRWSVGRTAERRILYPYCTGAKGREPIDLTLYPRARAYLDSHRERLEARHYLVNSGREWFEIWVPHKPSDWSAPKVVFPDISVEPRFFLDVSGCIVNGDCYWLKTKHCVETEWLYVLLGIGNSTLAVAYYDALFHNKLYAGRRRFMTQYVQAFPLPDISSPVVRRLCNVVRDIVNANPDSTQRLAMEIEANRLAWTAFGLCEEEVLGKRDLQLGVTH
jgi:tRNA1(Val) A37 N6-methylase TrmN6